MSIARPLLLLLVLFLIALSASGCYRIEKSQLNQTLQVTTQPTAAYVWTQDVSGKQDVGRAPVEVRRSYEVTRQRFNRWHWLWTAITAGATVAGGVMIGTDEGKTTMSSGQKVGGIVLTTLGACLLFPSLLMAIVGETQGKREVVASQTVMIGASAPGHSDRWASLAIPSPRTTLHISLPPVAEGLKLAALVGRPAGTSSRPIVAVFSIQDASKRLGAEVLDQLSEYLSTQIAATGRYRIVPRDRLRERLVDERRKSYRACYDEACQIELGKVLAAQKSLSSKLLRVGDRCALTSTIYDLRTETTEAAASVDTTCSVEALLGAARAVAQQLGAKAPR
jgi:hypothetical protein